ncbi:hypothetical protein [Streptomyces sp. NPDC046685]|uniref:hypothetical protein n=1 Tax=Streptomyces sp. NPDC046685 TaxID=3157202 RepID=UPI003410524E
MAVPDARVELQIGGTWTDVTDDVLHDQTIRYSWGRRGEGARTDPAAASLALRNPTGIYSNRNPTSPYYGQLGRNTPVRITHGGADIALVIPSGSQGRATTPDTAALDILGDIDVRAHLTPSAWEGTHTNGAWDIVSKYGAAGQRSWSMLQAGGGLFFRWSVDGTNVINTTATVYLPFAPGQEGAVRASLDVNNGAGGWTVTFYTAPTLAGPWTQLGNPVSGSGVTSIFNSTAPVEIGDITAATFAPVSRQIHAVEIRNSAGTVVANPDFTAQAAGTTSFADAAGRTWTIANGAEITDRRIRAQLEASSWAPRWGASGHDVTAPITAAGILRRLGQGAKPLASTLRRRLPAMGAVAYWPFEDGTEATRAYSPIAGCAPLSVKDFSFAADDSCPGSDALPSIGTAATMQGPVPAYTSATNGYLVAMIYAIDTMPASSSPWLAVTTNGTARGIVLSFTSTQVVAVLYNAAGAVITTQAFTNASVFGPGKWFRLDVTAQASGGNTDFHLGFVDVEGGGVAWNFSIAGVPGTVISIDTVFGSLLSGMRLGHLAVFPSSDVSVWGQADNGFRGDTPGARFFRLGVEENVPITTAQGPNSTTVMGPQRSHTLLDLLNECEDADGGILFEDPERAALFYRTRTTLYSQTPTVTIPYGQLAPPLEPVDDDRWLRNDRTVQRTGGSSARAVLTTGALSVQAPPLGVGTYADSRTLNVASDGVLQDIAAWLLHRGTWDESRYPRVRIYLHKYPELVPAVAALRPGHIIRITDLPVWLPPGPVDLMVEGAEEVFKTLEWTITLSCSPAGPWSVGVLDDAVLGRLDTAGSTLVSGVTSTATSLSVATPVGPLWATSGQTPFDIRVGGEVMTVTAVSGASSPQTFTVTRSVNAVVKSHSSAADVRLAQPMILAL